MNAPVLFLSAGLFLKLKFEIMLCESFEKLSHREKVEFIGKLVHVVQSFDTSFHSAKGIINYAEQCGYLEGVTIAPEPIPQNKPEDNGLFRPHP